MSTEDQKSTAKGEAFDRLVLALVAQSPKRPERSTLISSPSLAAAHRSFTNTDAILGGDEHKLQALSETEKRNAAKALGRMVSSDALREVVIPNGLDERIDLPESGLVAVSVSLPVLNADYDAWVEGGRNGPEPTQELLAETIRDLTVKWIIENRDELGIHLFLKDVWIVHGSTSFDMLVLVMYRSSRDFMSYVREVVQRVRGVLGTQTMQISNSLASNHTLSASE